MKILVLGNEGFVGSNLQAYLEDRGHYVIGWDIKGGLDVRGILPQIDERFDMVFHAAAVVGGRETIDYAPLKVAYDFGLDSDVIQFCARTKPDRVVLISSSAAYPVSLQTRESHRALSEDDISLADLKTPDAIYGMTKVVLEMQAEKLRDLGVAVTVVRPFSGYGSRQDREYPVPSFLDRAIRHDVPFVVWSDGTATRDFLYVDDLVHQMVTLAMTGVEGPVNLGTGLGTSFNELATMVCEEMGYKPILCHLKDKPEGVYYRVADVSIINRIAPAKISLREGIKLSLEQLGA